MLKESQSEVQQKNPRGRDSAVWDVTKARLLEKVGKGEAGYYVYVLI
jgi:hypothetical protein